ncbi:MAG TPA: sugar ABC transporter permease [Candidatus Limnocylindrales bacterium]|jgi:multiple sugar transport system permease protein
MESTATPAVAEAPPPVESRPAGRVGARQEALAGYTFISIPMILFAFLSIGLFLYAMYISVWNWNIRSGPINFVGLDNYARILSAPLFQTAIKNTLYYALIWVPLTMFIGLFLAVIVNQKIHGRSFFRAAFYFPAIASSAAITILWLFLVSPDGLFNEIRGALGLNPVFTFFGFTPNQDWMGNYHTAMNSIIILNAWTTSGTFMLFYLASLQSIPYEVYEAAEIDGASSWQVFWKITFPLLRPGHFFVATVGVIGALQLFDQAYIAGGVDGGPVNSLMTIVLYLYNQLFKQLNPGYAAAVGIVLFVIIFGLTLLQRRIFGAAPSW